MYIGSVSEMYVFRLVPKYPSEKPLHKNMSSIVSAYIEDAVREIVAFPLFEGERVLFGLQSLILGNVT